MQVLEEGKKPKGYGDFTKHYQMQVQHGQIEKPKVGNMKPCMSEWGNKMMISKTLPKQLKIFKKTSRTFYHRVKTQGPYQGNHAT